MNIEDLPDDSESSDEDYVPEGATVELPSEEESDGDPEDALNLADDLDKRGTKRQKKGRASKKKRRSNLQDTIINEETPKEVTKEVKQQTSALWADFIKDTGFKTRAERSQPIETSKVETSNDVKPNKLRETKLGVVPQSQPQKKVKVTEVYKFAGEEVEIEKEVDANAAEARLINTASSSDSSRKPAGGARINSILNQLGKKRKINTLEKSKLDWEKFKKDEDIGDELQAYSKSKDGYLERQDFLQRADLRRFEIEKEIRTTLRTNRTNNVNM